MAKQRTGARRFGRYELIYRFASGGMADLYLARVRGEENFERLIAIKVIHEHLSRHTEFVKMFIDEARLASRISHPNVALTLDLGRVGPVHFIAMEYIDGESLGAVLRRTRPPLGLAARIVSDAAAGLHAAHELRDADGNPLGVVHRDVSPQNILVSYEGAVKVVDFGVARARGSLHTTSSGFKGKFGYVAPEQVESPRDVDRRTDVFALGIVLYEATTRQRLFKGETDAQSLDLMLRGPIVPPRQREPDFPEDLQNIILRALEREPALRYSTAEELHQDLERFIAARGEPVHGTLIRDLMSGLFADHIAAKRAMLSRATSLDGGPVPDVDVISATEATASSPSLGEILPSSRVRWPVVLAVLLMAAAAGVALMALAFRGHQPAATAPRADSGPPLAQRRAASQPASRPLGADPSARTIAISVSAAPAAASIHLDGQPVSNPFTLRRPPGSGSAELVVSAPGYQRQQLLVPLSTGGTWSVELAKVHGGPPPVKRPPGKKQSVPRKKGEGYLDNPYDQ